MTQAFIHGFYDELTKQASHPLFQTVARGGTMLGQKVRGALSRTAEKSKKVTNRAARGAGLKGVVEKTSAAKLAFFENEEESGDDGEGSEADDAGEMLRRMMQQYQQDAGYSEEPDAAADQPLYGGGKGLPANPHAGKARSPHLPPAKPGQQKPPRQPKNPGVPMGGLAPPSRQTRPPAQPKPVARKLPTDLE